MKKLLLGLSSGLSILLPTAVLSFNHYSANNSQKNINLKSNSEEHDNTKYTIEIDGKQLIFNSKSEIQDYLTNKIKINRFVGKKEYSNFDWQINMDSNLLNEVDYSKIKPLYKDANGNSVTSQKLAIDSYLPDYAFVEKYFDHAGREFDNPEDAKNSISNNIDKDIVENLFYELEDKQGIKRYYNPLVSSDIKKFIRDFTNDKLKISEEKQEVEAYEINYLKNKIPKSYILYSTLNDGKFFSELFTRMFTNFVSDNDIKNNFFVKINFINAFSLNNKVFARPYFKYWSSSEDYINNRKTYKWQTSNDGKELYKYVDYNWFNKYFSNAALNLNFPSRNKYWLVNNWIKQKFKGQFTNEEYYGPGWLTKVKERRNVYYFSKRAHIKYREFLLSLKSSQKFLDFDNLEMKTDTFIVDNENKTYNGVNLQENLGLDKTIAILDFAECNSFGLQISSYFDKERMLEKIKYKKNNLDFFQFMKDAINTFNLNINTKNSIINSLSLIKNNNKIIWNFLINKFKEIINKFQNNIFSEAKNIKVNLELTRNSVRNSHFKKESSNLTANLLSISKNIIDKIAENKKNIILLNKQPIIFNNNKQKHNVSNYKNSVFNDFLVTINLGEYVEKEQFLSLLQKQKNKFSKYKYFDKSSNYFYLNNIGPKTFLNFIQQEKINNENYIRLNNSYNEEKTFRSEQDRLKYIDLLKSYGLRPESRYVISGLQEKLQAHGIELPLNEINFNDKKTIKENYRAILQKLILPSTEKIYYLENGKYYILNSNFFNLWNIELDNKKYYFEDSDKIAAFIESYINKKAKPYNLGDKNEN
ncbi:hypothetical protein DMC14_002830 [Metamycoplasma phocicerebrale]|uniref:Uncharacterized protein n=1 Tax=Metamycoplasma phocicerebrale TaxID=142649 RepID=A0A3T0TUA9_9BACT|nr:hypothetical protein [Metamycoplasma phocicerebrale]AZZ65701.1 hypothetical protein DMC14_002830 [Metamycoplasma phocicerebrale]